MKRIITVLFLSLVLFTCGVDIAVGKTIKVNKDRLITIDFVIDGEPMLESINQFSRMIDTKKPIYIVLDSAGGAVTLGLQFIQLMHRAQARGIKTHCIVTNQAMSMAFGIFSQCDYRYGFNSSLLLWHKVRQMAMYVTITRHKGKVWEHQIGILDDYLDTLIFKSMDVEQSYYDFSSNNDIVHTGMHVNKVSPGFMLIIHDFVLRGGR